MPVARRPAVSATAASSPAGQRLIYLDGNSLGRLPRRTRARLLQVIDDEWATGLAGSWESWIDLPHRIGDALAEHLLGARPGEVVVGDSTTGNLYKAASAAVGAVGPTARALVTDDDNFPTDRYVLEGIAARPRLHGRGERSSHPRGRATLNCPR